MESEAEASRDDIEKKIPRLHLSDSVKVIDSSHSESENVIASRIKETAESSLHLSLRANRRASFFKAITIVCQLAVVAMGMAISLLTIGGSGLECETVLYTVCVLAVLIMSVEGLRSGFSFEKRGGKFKQIGADAKLIYMRVKDIGRAGLSDDEIINKINSYNTKIINYELAMYDTNMVNITTTSGYTRKLPSHLTEPVPLSLRKDFVPIGGRTLKTTRLNV